MDNYYLLSTKDTTDRSKEIEACLHETGACRLGAGVFYVKNIVMPEDSMIAGEGIATRLILIDDTEECFVIKMASRCVIKDLHLIGSEEAITPQEETGNRHGIVFEGSKEKPGTEGPIHCTIENCYVEQFTGGALTCRNSGYPVSSSLNVSDCWFIRCGVGINIPFWSEYHKFTNVVATRCWHGCINNGGNNMFMNCNFSENELAFLMDNSQKQSVNETHGSAIGCTFNHSGSNKGTGIRILGTRNGYVFSGCQVFYSKIELDDVKGVVFDAFNFGRNEVIDVKKGGLVMFTNCMFGTEPQITVEENEHTKFINCYTRGGEVVG
jgi:hypothetical protein